MAEPVAVILFAPDDRESELIVGGDLSTMKFPVTVAVPLDTSL